MDQPRSSEPREVSSGLLMPADGRAKVPKKTRRRILVSCLECHRRKRKCNREIPCDSCTARGIAEQCILQAADHQPGAKPATKHTNKLRSVNSSSASTGSLLHDHAGHQTTAALVPGPSLAIDNERLASRVKYLEDVLRDVKNGVKRDCRLELAGGLETAGQAPPTPGEETAMLEPGSLAQSEPFAMIGRMSKALPTEGGSETRIYSGGASMLHLLDMSGVLRKENLMQRRRPRASTRELYMHMAGEKGICNMTHAMVGIPDLADTMQTFRSKLPPPTTCHFLFAALYRCPFYDEMARNMPRKCIQLCYDGLFEPSDIDTSSEAVEARQAGFPQLASPRSLAFISLILSILANAIVYQPGAMQDTTMQEYASGLHEASRAAFMASERREQPTYSAIYSLITQAGWLKAAGSPSLGYTYIAQAIRLAQAMGMHREPAASWGLGRFEIEVRRRTWYMLDAYDKGHALSHGRPYVINAKHCDIKEPANINEQDLTADGPVNVKPKHEITETTLQLCNILFSDVSAKIVDSVCSSQGPSYKTILELDDMLMRIENDIVPAGFKNPSASDLLSKPYLKMHSQAFHTRMCWIRGLLHRPYLLKKLPEPGQPDHYAGSRSISISSSQRMITLVREAVMGVPLHMRVNFFFAFMTFEPAVTLAIAILQNPSDPTVAALESTVCDAIQLLESMSAVNLVAQEGLDTLDFLLEQCRVAINNAKVRAAPPGQLDLGCPILSKQQLAAKSGGTAAAAIQMSSFTGDTTTTRAGYFANPTPDSTIAIDSTSSSSSSSNGERLQVSSPPVTTTSMAASMRTNSSPSNAPTPNTSFQQFFGDQQQSSSANNHVNHQQQQLLPHQERFPLGTGSSFQQNQMSNDQFMQSSSHEPTASSATTTTTTTFDGASLFKDLADPNADWLTQADQASSIDYWPAAVDRLEGDTALEEWSRLFGFEL